MSRDNKHCKQDKFSIHVWDKVLVKWARYLKTLRIFPIRDWSVSFLKTWSGEDGWKLFFSILGIYLTLYTLFVAKHELLANRASFERATFISMVSSKDENTITIAMKNFGKVQNMIVPKRPSLFFPVTWFEKEKPNEKVLKMWSYYFFSSCTSKSCKGIDFFLADLEGADLEDAELESIRLSGANLHNANLQKANLEGADLTGTILTATNLEGAILNKIKGGTIFLDDNKIAKDSRIGSKSVNTNFQSALLNRAKLIEAELSEAILIDADLRAANLDKANLRGATLDGAELYGSSLNKTDLRSVDLSKVVGLTQKQINQACVDEHTKLPNLQRPQPCSNQQQKVAYSIEARKQGNIIQ